MFTKKAQISMEYLIIVGMASLIILPLLVLFFAEMSDITETMTISQINKIGDELTNSINEVYYLGEPAQKTLSFYMPSRVDEVLFMDKMIVFVINLQSSSFSIVKYAAINVTGNMSAHKGSNRIIIAAREDYVLVSDKI